MEDTRDSLAKKEFVDVCVRDPQLHKESFWHMYMDYDICLHTNSMCFCKKRSSVRRRYKEFVWLRQRLQDNALLIQLPKLPPANPFFSLSNACHVTQRMQGLQMFLEEVLQMPLLLSDSCLHLFLQTQLSVGSIDACIQGRTRYTVAQAIQCSAACPRLPLEENKSYCDSDCESTASSGLGVSVGPPTPSETSPDCGSPAHRFLSTPTQPEAFKCWSSSHENQQDMRS
ncbi:sorting nexin-10A isoform X2 [Brachyhypopomus gauderio]